MGDFGFAVPWNNRSSYLVNNRLVCVLMECVWSSQFLPCY